MHRKGDSDTSLEVIDIDFAKLPAETSYAVLYASCRDTKFDGFSGLSLSMRGRKKGETELNRPLAAFEVGGNGGVGTVSLIFESTRNSTDNNPSLPTTYMYTDSRRS